MTIAPRTLAQACQIATSQGLPRLDAQLLLLHVLGRSTADRAWLLAHDEDVLGDLARLRYESLCARRQDGEPLAYITGSREFYGLTLQVDGRVLDPRPDTETLVDWALSLDDLPRAARVRDLGTGSGAIALALKANRPQWQVSAVDRSADALAVAQANALRLGLPVPMQQSDWLDSEDGPFDLLVSNPPYVAEGDPHLAALGHEPRQALTAGPDGLDDLRHIIAQAPSNLSRGGWLLLEHGHDQAAAVCELLAVAGFTAVGTRNDLAGIQRCSGGKWPGDR